MTTRVRDVSPAGLMGLAHLVNMLGGQALQSHQLLLTEKTIALLAKRLRLHAFRAVNETPTKHDDLVSKKLVFKVALAVDAQAHEIVLRGKDRR
jgi:hypothetical protein